MPPRLLERVHEAIRARHYSPRTAKAYVGWIRRFILFHGRRHPATMGSEQITQYLTHLAVEGKVSPSTQTQALSAILFLYRSSSSRTSRSWKTSCEPSRRSDCRSF